METCACSIVYYDCRWNCGHVQEFILIVGGNVCFCLVVYKDFLWNCVLFQYLILIDGAIVCMLRNL